MGLEPGFLELLACPKCHGDLTEHEDPHRLVCETCRLAYPVRDNIPVMLIDEAKSLDDD
ncbi:MAG: Trm112 family protein [Acidimicrobiia bacterium]|nr:Trm112 family protein [Acidimicrobiia bacterium]MDH3470262.1 Trm112 family protein [Acidimicrobiia bacterium]